MGQGDQVRRPQAGVISRFPATFFRSTDIASIGQPTSWANEPLRNTSFDGGELTNGSFGPSAPQRACAARRRRGRQRRGGRHVSRDIDTSRVAFCGTENISTLTRLTPLNSSPAPSPVNASRLSSRKTVHHSGPVRFAAPSP